MKTPRRLLEVKQKGAIMGQISEGLGKCNWDPVTEATAHQFQPRYDEEVPGEMAAAIIDVRKNCRDKHDLTISEFVKMIQKRTYVCDICTKCGAVVKREE